MELIKHLLHTGLSTVVDVLPIVVIIFGFQLLVLRQEIPNLKSVLVGFVYVLAGLTLFLVGLEEALFPVGKLMAQQLTDPAFITGTDVPARRWTGATTSGSTCLPQPSVFPRPLRNPR